MVTWKQRLQGATLYALKFIKTIKSKENKTMENVFYKSYEDCGDYFYNEDLEDGSDGCLYCFDCIHDHLEDEEEIA